MPVSITEGCRAGPEDTVAILDAERALFAACDALHAIRADQLRQLCDMRGSGLTDH